MDTRGITLDDVQGIARVRDLKVGYKDRSLDAGDFFVQSLFAGGTRTLSLNSDYLVMAASGQFELDQMSKDLQKKGFKFVGSTICYAFMQAVGMFNDHEVGCFRYTEVKRLRIVSKIR